MLTLGLSLVVLLLFFIYLKVRTTNKKQKDNGNEGKRKLLRQLRDMDKFEPDTYEGETKEEVEKLKSELYELMDEIMDKNNDLKTSQEKFNKFKKKQHISSLKIRKKISDWDLVELEAKEIIEEAKDFFENTNFYPPDFLFEINKLESKIEDIAELKKADPYHPDREFSALATDIRYKIQRFVMLKEKTAKLIEKIDAVRDKINKKKMDRILDKKQEIFIHLQNGKLEEAQKGLKELNSMVKKEIKFAKETDKELQENIEKHLEMEHGSKVTKQLSTNEKTKNIKQKTNDLEK